MKVSAHLVFANLLIALLALGALVPVHSYDCNDEDEGEIHDHVGHAAESMLRETIQQQLPHASLRKGEEQGFNKEDANEATNKIMTTITATTAATNEDPVMDDDTLVMEEDDSLPDPLPGFGCVVLTSYLNDDCTGLMSQITERIITFPMHLCSFPTLFPISVKDIYCDVESDPPAFHETLYTHSRICYGKHLDLEYENDQCYPMPQIYEKYHVKGSVRAHCMAGPCPEQQLEQLVDSNSQQEHQFQYLLQDGSNVAGSVGLMAHQAAEKEDKEVVGFGETLDQDEQQV